MIYAQSTVLGPRDQKSAPPPPLPPLLPAMHPHLQRCPLLRVHTVQLHAVTLVQRVEPVGACVTRAAWVAGRK